MKYLYNKFEKLCFPDDLDTIFNYCNSFNDVGILRIELNFSYLFNKEKQIFLHKYIILLLLIYILTYNLNIYFITIKWKTLF